MMSKRSEITETMRERIRRGKWKPGQQLPTVREVCEEFEVSTATAVYAMLDLGELVDARQGEGYFVARDVAKALRDVRAPEVVDAHKALVALRNELDEIIARLAA